MNSVLRLGIGLIATSLLAACASQGRETRIALPPMPRGEQACMVAHDLKVPNWMVADSKRKLDFYTLSSCNEITAEQLQAVASIEQMCRVYTGTVHPSNLVAVASGTILYTVMGAVGVGTGSQAFPGASFRRYAMYGGLAAGFSGGANSMITLGGKSYTFQNCGREFLARFQQYGVSGIISSPW